MLVKDMKIFMKKKITKNTSMIANEIENIVSKKNIKFRR